MIEEQTGVDRDSVRIPIPSDDNFLGLPPGLKRDVAISGIACVVLSAITIPQFLAWQKISLIGSAAAITAAGWGCYESAVAGTRWLAGKITPATGSQLRRGLVTVGISSIALAALHTHCFFAQAQRLHQ